MIIRADSEHTRGRCSRCFRTSDMRDTSNLTCKQQGFQRSSRGCSAVRGCDGSHLRLDLLSRTRGAKVSDLRIMAWSVRHAARLLSHFQAGSAGKAAHSRQFEKTHDSPVLPVGDRVTWRDPTLQPAKLKCGWRFALGWRYHRRATLTSVVRRWTRLWPCGSHLLQGDQRTLQLGTRQARRGARTQERPTECLQLLSTTAEGQLRGRRNTAK